ncbi:aldehyde dehydrogenase family protein [Thalassotalea maritima]|uniref:aldehyde dehydrogenase family protein n=1 Tax=Thalassotalea maritima TaxID=3242416 RepID=UPI0035293BBC
MSQTLTRNPYTGDVIAKYPQDSLSVIDEKIAHLRQRFQQWQMVDVAERVALLRSACDYFEANRKQIAQDITEQMGKPLSQANQEINGFFERANYLLANAQTFLADDIILDDNSCEQRISHQPLGVVVVIAAWNYPLLIAVNSVLTALLCGNTVLLKHASMTTAIGEHFQRAFGHIPGHEHLLLQTVTDHDVMANVLQHSDISHVVFTGSSSGGQHVYQQTAHQLNPCHLELGGKDAAYVDIDTDIDKAAASLVDGAMYNAGQSCCGIERVYVHEKIYDAFIDACLRIIADYRLGDPMDEGTSIGPLASAESAILMREHVSEAVAQGAMLLTGGDSQTIGHAIFFQPTLLANTNNSMQVMREENFGPILPLMAVTDMFQAIKLINDNHYGLSAAIYSNDNDKATEFANCVEVGTVFQNRCDYLAPALPWTGWKQSGIGSGLSKYGFYGLTKRRAINFNKKL